MKLSSAFLSVLGMLRELGPCAGRAWGALKSFAVAGRIEEVESWSCAPARAPSLGRHRTSDSPLGASGLVCGRGRGGKTSLYPATERREPIGRSCQFTGPLSCLAPCPQVKPVAADGLISLLGSQIEGRLQTHLLDQCLRGFEINPGNVVRPCQKRTRAVALWPGTGT